MLDKDWFEKAYFNAALIENFYEDYSWFIVAEDLRKFFLRPSLGLRVLIKNLNEEEKLSILEKYEDFNNNNNFKDLLLPEILNEIKIKYLEKKDPIEAVIEIYKEYDRVDDIDLSGPDTSRTFFYIFIFFAICTMIITLYSNIQT